MNLRTAVIATLISGGLAAPVLGRDAQIINQAHPDAQVMRFYLHPAHLYLLDRAPNSMGEHPAVLVKRGFAPPTIRGDFPMHPALQGQPRVLAASPSVQLAH